jgi:ATP-dependent protease HslVU (ClpYQ) peptidase subunit
MTTVAYTKGVLAFDSKASSGGQHAGWVMKGKKTNKYLIAACGSCEDIQAFMDWMESGGKQEDKKTYGLDRDVDINALVIDKKTRVYQYEGRLYPYVIEADIHALGSGREYAIGAMAAGSSAQQAVRIASKYDSGTGGAVKTLYWDKK